MVSDRGIDQLLVVSKLQSQTNEATASAANKTESWGLQSK